MNDAQATPLDAANGTFGMGITHDGFNWQASRAGLLASGLRESFRGPLFLLPRITGCS